MKHVLSLSLVAGSAFLASACGGAAAVETTTTTPVVAAQQSALVIGGDQSNFGGAELDTGFLPDPHAVQIVSGATAADAVAIADQGLTPQNGGACRGYATSTPDYIVRVGNAGSYLRFAVEAPGDTTLVINDGAGNWWCSDDEGGSLNPLIEMQNPVTGQYDIWVGSYEAGANIQGVLSVSELPH